MLALWCAEGEKGERHPKMANCCCLTLTGSLTELHAFLLGCWVIRVVGIKSASCGWLMHWVVSKEGRRALFLSQAKFQTPCSYTWHDTGSPGLTAWDWHPFFGTSSSTCLTMWQAISVLAWKERTHYFLGSFFAGLAGWVRSSCVQTHGNDGESQGVDNKALASGGGGRWLGSPVSLPIPSERDVSVPRELGWYLIFVNISYKGLKMSLEMNRLDPWRQHGGNCYEQ